VITLMKSGRMFQFACVVSLLGSAFVVVQMWRIHYSASGDAQCPASLEVSNRFAARLRLATDSLALSNNLLLPTFTEWSQEKQSFDDKRADSVSDTAALVNL